MVSGYPTFTSIPRVDGLSTDPRVLGSHRFVRPSLPNQVCPARFVWPDLSGQVRPARFARPGLSGQGFQARFVLSGSASQVRVFRPGLSWQVCPARFVQLGLTIHVRPPTSDGHSFFARTPFRVFLNSMESPLSQDSIHVPVENSG